MPFNKRPVEVLTMAKRVAPVAPSPAMAKEDAEREFVAKRNAQDAVTISQYMRGYARDVDQELRTSTIAHLKTFLAPRPHLRRDERGARSCAAHGGGSLRGDAHGD